MRRRRIIAHVLGVIVLTACAGRPPNPTVLPSPSTTTTLLPTVTAMVGGEAVTPTSLPATQPPTNGTADAETYTSRNAPLARRNDEPQATLRVDAAESGFSLETGVYRLSFNRESQSGAVMLVRPDNSTTGLALRPLGAEINLLPYVQHLSGEASKGQDRIGVTFTGSAPWADFTFRLWAYPYNPGLIHYRLELTPWGDLPSGAVHPEWTFVDPATGDEAPAGYAGYADKAAFTSPAFYGYVEKMDSTLLHWVDVTRLNPFIEATGYAPPATPVRQGRSFGHNVNSSDLRRLPPGQMWTVYDSYLYITPGAPEDEPAMFLRYLQEVSDVYDLIGHPAAPLPDWQALARNTLTDLNDPDTWVLLNGKRYWRAYVADTRLSAEAITQLDVGLGAARYAARYGPSDLTQPILDDVLAALPDFYNPAYGLVQNSGPLAISGDQTRGDTWYEVGHALKLAELGLLGYDGAAALARDSQAAWMDFAHVVNYAFPQFYTFNTWKGAGQEPDAGGGYALYMLRLSELGCGDPCVQEAESAVRAFPGHGFAFAYETHMTAMAALAAAELANLTGDDAWLNYAYGPVANLVRLSWIYEVDYGLAARAHTFFGLGPTQRAAAITPKEQYEAWVYLNEFLRRAHGRIDPGVEKLVAEFLRHTLVTLADSFPPRLPEGVATLHPAAYETVATNRLDLYIPLEDMRAGQSGWGSIGQQVYGAGLAPTFAALAYAPVTPSITVYSGYPLAKVEGTTITLTGVPDTYTPMVVTGTNAVRDQQGNRVPAVACDAALCFQAEGSGVYQLGP